VRLEHAIRRDIERVEADDAGGVGDDDCCAIVAQTGLSLDELTDFDLPEDCFTHVLVLHPAGPLVAALVFGFATNGIGHVVDNGVC